jgi:hypothetical protein
VAHSAIFNFEDIVSSLPKIGPALDLEATPERPDILDAVAAEATAVRAGLLLKESEEGSTNK